MSCLEAWVFSLLVFVQHKIVYLLASLPCIIKAWVGKGTTKNLGLHAHSPSFAARLKGGKPFQGVVMQMQVRLYLFLLRVRADDCLHYKRDGWHLEKEKIQPALPSFHSQKTREAIEQADNNPQPAATTNLREGLPDWLHCKIQNFQFFKLRHTTKWESMA